MALNATPYITAMSGILSVNVQEQVNIACNAMESLACISHIINHSSAIQKKLIVIIIIIIKKYDTI